MEEVANQPQYDPNKPVTSLVLLDFEASIFQDGDVTGSDMRFKVEVLVNGEPAGHAQVGAKVELPDGNTEYIDFEETKPGHYKYAYTTTIDGEYKFLVRVKGTTNDGREFREEKTLSGAVYTDFT